MKEKHDLEIQLTSQQIDLALLRVTVGLERYLAIQEKFDQLSNESLRDSLDFKKSFNGFYRVRQKPAAWYKAFYDIFDESRGISTDYRTVIETLYDRTNRIEASFASKLLATLNPEMPVIDSIVLSRLNTKLPRYYESNRLEKICLLHDDIKSCYQKFLKTSQGKDLITSFKRAYPQANITEIKMLDLVLWQSRE